MLRSSEIDGWWWLVEPDTIGSYFVEVYDRGNWKFSRDFFSLRLLYWYSGPCGSDAIGNLNTTDIKRVFCCLLPGKEDSRVQTRFLSSFKISAYYSDAGWEAWIRVGRGKWVHPYWFFCYITGGRKVERFLYSQSADFIGTSGGIKDAGGWDGLSLLVHPPPAAALLSILSLSIPNWPNRQRLPEEILELIGTSLWTELSEEYISYKIIVPISTKRCSGNNLQ